jgi:hypothetical protein
MFIKQGEINIRYLLIVVILAIIVGGGISWLLQKQTPFYESLEVKIPEKGAKITDGNEVNINATDTKIYHSDKLGVEFTYDQIFGYPSDPPIKVAEIGNKIYVYSANDKPEEGQSIEVFQKDPKISLQDAIEDKFLAGIDPKDCFVKTYANNDPMLSETSPNLPSYITAGIAYPPSDDPDAFGWDNSKCPKGYSETNGIQYFLENTDVPGKFLFIVVGQYMITTNGGNGSWSNSIRILK